jgi:hypothetical protein
MKQVLEFTTKLNQEEIIKTLKDNTHPTEYEFQTLLFGKEYFSGQVSGKKIRIKNATRQPRNPSPILDISLIPNDTETKVIIKDDSDGEINLNKSLLLTITISISVVVLLVGGILSFIQPDNYSIIWTITISVSITTFGLIRSFFYRQTTELNRNGDLDFLLRLLKK